MKRALLFIFLILVSSRSAAADTIPAPGVPRITEEEACATARRLTPMPVTEARLVTRGQTLAWYVAPRDAAMASAPVVLIDATTGRVLEARERIHHASALTYAENPVRTPTTSLLPLPATSASIAARSCVDRGGLVTVTIDDVAHPLRTCALESVAVPDGSGNYTDLPRVRPTPMRSAADPFAETSARFHAASLLDFLGSLDGVAPLPETPLSVVAGARIAPGLLGGDYAAAGESTADLVPFAQSFYLPGAGTDEGAAFRALYGTTASAVWLGQGANVDLAYDGDVVAHETTHAVVDATLRIGGWRLREDGISDEPEALNEALADYFAAALTNDPILGEYAVREDPAATARSLANAATCSAVDGEPHDDSAIFSGALWRARTASGDATSFDRAVYRAMKLGGVRDLGFADFGAMVTDSVPAALAPAFAAELTRAGIPCATSFPLVPGTAHRSTTRGFAAPGTLAAGSTPAPGLFQLRIELPAQPATVRIVFTGQRLVPSPLFARNGTSFHPIVVAGWDHALHWTYDPTGNDADSVVTADGAASYVATLSPPAGTRAIWVQIANDGENDGLYDAVSAEVDLLPSATDGGATLGTPDASTAAPVLLRGSGSSCMLAPPASSSMPAFLVLGLLVLHKTRRRRTAEAIPRRRGCQRASAHFGKQ